MSQLLTPRQVAERLNIGEDKLRKMRYSGKGPHALKLGHRTIRYRPEDVEDWLDRSSTDNPAKQEKRHDNNP